ncbi:MBL fold metallo-hydrolase [Actinoplanes awajinensis]|uniref:MBL fold metallo-hydrolase n=1 Tax=Actinoplanes awajinensis subsp. mycoplanecinus TaxID=135947 RepID=A0A117MPK2_9ACTN|nr:MBL fold metallo-hydrolase [Actinoplanes awajinensis]KUL28749.1 MBL fold metallo-hydrolase [Actinoplanes awajinensis subsp. mycoplanecinus]
MNDIKLGDVTVTRVEEMHGPLMPTGAFFPTVPDEVWQRHEAALTPDHLADGIVHAAVQTWVLRSEGRTILIDTGVGNDKPRPAAEFWDHLSTDFLGSLARAGVQPEDVDLVVNTHLHVDHIGWNTRLVHGEWVPTFPNATYLMPRPDVVFWDPANNPAIAGGVNENAFADSVVPVLSSGQVQQWEGSHDIDANLRLEAAPGHTPGSSVLKLTSGTDRALFAGDLVHTPLQVMELGHSSCFCEDPRAAGNIRRELLGWAADTGALVLPAHFSGHGALEIARDADAFTIKQWSPLSRL